MHNAETIKDKIKHHFYLWKNSRKKKREMSILTLFVCAYMETSPFVRTILSSLNYMGVQAGRTRH